MVNPALLMGRLSKIYKGASLVRHVTSFPAMWPWRGRCRSNRKFISFWPMKRWFGVHTWLRSLLWFEDGVCSLSSDEFFRDDVLALIFSLSVSWFFFLFYICFIVFVCTSSTIYNNNNNLIETEIKNFFHIWNITHCHRCCWKVKCCFILGLQIFFLHIKRRLINMCECCDWYVTLNKQQKQQNARQNA